MTTKIGFIAEDYVRVQVDVDTDEPFASQRFERAFLQWSLDEDIPCGPTSGGPTGFIILAPAPYKKKIVAWLGKHMEEHSS